MKSENFEVGAAAAFANEQCINSITELCWQSIVSLNKQHYCKGFIGGSLQSLALIIFIKLQESTYSMWVTVKRRQSRNSTTNIIPSVRFAPMCHKIHVCA